MKSNNILKRIIDHDQWASLVAHTNSMDVSLGNFETPYTMDGRREEDGQIDKQMDG